LRFKGPRMGVPSAQEVEVSGLELGAQDYKSLRASNFG
jgi:hypothetical protein